MIAPLREIEPRHRPVSSALRAARRSVAEMFLDHPADAPRPAAGVQPWNAWLFAAWTMAVAAFYLAIMLGLA